MGKNTKRIYLALLLLGLDYSAMALTSGNYEYSSSPEVLLDKDLSVLLQYCFGNTRTSYTIPDIFTEVADGELIQYLKNETSAIAPEIELETDWIFTGWDKTFMSFWEVRFPILRSPQLCLCCRGGIGYVTQ